jgi:hypothetical protein
MVRNAELPRHMRRVSAVKIVRCGDAVGGQRADAGGQAVPVGHRLGPQATKVVRGGMRAGSDHARPDGSS